MATTKDKLIAGAQKLVEKGQFERAVKTYGARLTTKYLEPTSGGQGREELLRLLAEGKYDLIIGVGFLFTDAMTKVAKDFPAARFAIVDGCPDAPTANV